MSRRHFRVFMASPGDVVAERELALTVLDRLAYEPTFRHLISLEAVAWDKEGAGAPMLANITPQDSIALGLPRPSECDIVVVVFWSRMGTPLPDSYMKPDGSRYLSGTEWEYEDAIAGALSTGGSPKVLVYRCTRPVILDLDDPDFQAKFNQYELVKSFFGSFQNPDGSYGRGYSSYEIPSKFQEKLEYDLKSLIATGLSDFAGNFTDSKAVPLPPRWPGSPFPGLRAFTAEDEPIFFGRERETDALVDRIKENDFVLVVGASGSGKSSLIGAGLIPRIPAMTNYEKWVVIQTTPDLIGSGDPYSALASSLIQNIEGLKGRNLAKDLRNSTQKLTEIFASFRDEGKGPTRLMLFVDQFEELFTTTDPVYRSSYIEMLAELTNSGFAKVVVTVRGDFYGRCLEFPGLAKQIEQSTFPLSVPTFVALQRMIVGPAARAELQFEEGLAEKILEDTGAGPGSLALMAYTLDELFRLSEGGELLSLENYETLGGVQGAIGKRSELVFSALSDSEQEKLPYVFRELVEVDERGTATRQRAPLSSVARSREATKLLNALTDARLLVKSRDTENQPIVEVAHEALLTNWKRLSDWIRDTQDDLRLLRQVRVAAREWDNNNRREDFLWSHERLEPVYAMRSRLDVEFEQLVDEFTRPEFERLKEDFRRNRKYFNQKGVIERFSKIGAIAIPAAVDLLPHAFTKSAKGDLHALFREFSAESVKHLLLSLKSDHPRTRARATEAYGMMTDFFNDEFVIPLLQDSDEDVQLQAIVALSVNRSEKGFQAMCIPTAKRSAVVDLVGVIALASFGRADSIPFLQSVMGRTEKSLRESAAFLIGFLGSRSRASSYYREYQVRHELRLSEYLPGTSDRSALLMELCLALVKVEGDLHSEIAEPKLLNVLCRMLKHPDSESRLVAVTALARISSYHSVSRLARSLDDTNSDVSEGVVRALGAISHKACIPALQEALVASRKEIRSLAANQLSLGCEENSNFRDLVRRSPITETLVGRYDDEDIVVKRTIAAALGSIRYVPAIPLLQGSLVSIDPELRAECTRALGKIAVGVDSAELIRMLQDPNQEVKAAAAAAIGALGKPDGGEALLASLDSKWRNLSRAESDFKRAVILSLIALKYDPAIPRLQSIFDITDDYQIRGLVNKCIRFQMGPGGKLVKYWTFDQPSKTE